MTARAAQCKCGVHGFAMNPCDSTHPATAPYYREARVTLPRRQTACGMRHCCARRIVECLGRRRLVCTSTRLAERQRMIEAEANRLAMLNAETPRAGIPTPEAQRSFEIETANQKPFSWGIKRGPFSFVKENGPLCPVQRHWRCFPRGAARRLKLWEQVNDLREHEKRRLNA
jgi:hypothetical protein